MNTLHYPHWPTGMAHTLSVPATSVYQNLATSALRYPDKAAIIYYGKSISYAELNATVEKLAAFLQHECGVKRGDRVLLNMQNSPQFVLAFYAIMRADAMVVPVPPMLVTPELAYYAADSGANVAFTGQELTERWLPLVQQGTVGKLIVATYSDYLNQLAAPFNLPDFVMAPYEAPVANNVLPWRTALACTQAPLPHLAGVDDLAVMPYTSGTTGKPKGCIHSHKSLMFTAAYGGHWLGNATPDVVGLASLPFFHVTGMQSSMNSLIYNGATNVIMSRWDRDVAGKLISAYKVTICTMITTMMIDFLANPKLADYDLSSLKFITGGGAAMPVAVAQKLLDLTGLKFIEGYGLSETMAPSHANPRQRPKQQCLGIPIFNTDARVINPVTLNECAQGEVGEIIMRGPQVFKGYWRDEAKTAEAFIVHDGERFFRSGDLGYIDEEGFFFYTDRLKRMINASGFKVWPAEVEALMYQHPAVQECCIIGAHDAYRGETVKAVVVKKVGMEISAEALMEWARSQMAATKVPRMVDFVESLPKSPSGKVMWRLLQDKEKEKGV